MAEAYIIDAVRTPRGIGKQGKGALAHMHPQHLAATCLTAIKDRNDLDTSRADSGLLLGTCDIVKARSAIHDYDSRGPPECCQRSVDEHIQPERWVLAHDERQLGILS